MWYTSNIIRWPKRNFLHDGIEISNQHIEHFLSSILKTAKDSEGPHKLRIAVHIQAKREENVMSSHMCLFSTSPTSHELHLPHFQWHTI
jgi:hypothetical protein